MEIALALLLLVGAAWFVLGPLREGRAEAGEHERAGREADLDAARDAKYREIREAELDFRTGKLSEDDWHALDRQLRGEAIEILRELDTRPRGLKDLDFDAVILILEVLQVVVAIALIFLVLMHSGKDAGLSGAFGVGSGQGPLGGGSLVERNLNRWTVFFAVVFVVNTLILVKFG